MLEGEWVPNETKNKGYLKRGKEVMLSVCLAELYGVDTKVLMQAIKRHIDRFPEDFMFQLTAKEAQAQRSQIVTFEQEGDKVPRRLKYSKHRPYAFTEQGVSMLSR